MAPGFLDVVAVGYQEGLAIHVVLGSVDFDENTGVKIGNGPARTTQDLALRAFHVDFDNVRRTKARLPVDAAVESDTTDLDLTLCGKVAHGMIPSCSSEALSPVGVGDGGWHHRAVLHVIERHVTP